MKHFPEIYGHLDRVQNYVHDKQIEKNPIFTDDAKSRAEEFCSFLTEKSVHSAINFNLDVQAKLTQESLTFQTRYSTIVGDSKREQRLLQAMDEIRDQGGVNLNRFLQETTCYSPGFTNPRTCMHIHDFENAFHVTYRGINLHETPILDQKTNIWGLKYPRLTSYKDTYIQEMKDQINKFYPSQGDPKKGKIKMSIFDVLDPSTYPIRPNDKQNFVPGSIEEVANLFQVDRNGLQAEFNRVLKQAFSTDLHCKNRKSNALFYWTEMMNNIEMSQPLKYLLMAVFSVPFSSSDSERV